MMRHDRNEPTNERQDRYAEAMRDPGSVVDRRVVTGVYPGLDRPARETLSEWQVRAVVAVADAEQAELQAARDECERQFQAQVGVTAAEQTRAEAAEAEVERLRGEIRDRESERADLRDRVQKAEAQVSRVEALLDVWEENGVQPAALPVENVRAALKDPS